MVIDHEVLVDIPDRIDALKESEIHDHDMINESTEEYDDGDLENDSNKADV